MTATVTPLKPRTDWLDTPCRYCGESARRLLLKAMLQDMGVQCSSGADTCWAREDGGEHDFTEKEKA